jgi:hypothetical protein
MTDRFVNEFYIDIIRTSMGVKSFNSIGTSPKSKLFPYVLKYQVYDAHNNNEIGKNMMHISSYPD